LWYRQSTLVLNMQYKHREPLIKSKNTLSRHTPGRLRTPGACQNLVKTINYSALSGKLVPDIFTRICPIFVLSRSRSLFQTRLYRLLPCNRTSCIHAVVDAGHFGLHVLGNCSCIALLLYIPVHISRHFLHPVGRIHQHDEAHS